jgi:hypothetical protein
MNNFWKKTLHEIYIRYLVTNVIEIRNLREKKIPYMKFFIFITYVTQVVDSVCYLSSGCYKHDNFEKEKKTF